MRGWILGCWQDQPCLKPSAPVGFLQNQMAVPAIATPPPAAVAVTHDFQLSSPHHFGQGCKHRAHVQLPRSVVLKRALCQGPLRSPGLRREGDTRLLATFSHCVSASGKRRRKSCRSLARQNMSGDMFALDIADTYLFAVIHL